MELCIVRAHVSFRDGLAEQCLVCEPTIGGFGKSPVRKNNTQQHPIFDLSILTVYVPPVGG